MNKLKTIAQNLACRFILAPKSIFQPPCNTVTITAKKNDIALLCSTSNKVLKIKTQEGDIFFRECKRHTSKKELVAREIEYYYTEICPENSDDRTFVENALLDRKNFKKFVNMGITNDLSSPVYAFCSGGSSSLIGLDTNNEKKEARLRSFAQYMWGELFVYNLNLGVKHGAFQNYNATRSIATFRLCELLGLDLIPKTEYAILKIDENQELFGSVMKEAVGIDLSEMQKQEREYILSPALQRALNNLAFLDALTHEKDHRPDNYRVITKQEKGVSVTAFDNDAPNTFGIGGISFNTYLGASPYILNGKLNRPFVDKKLATRLAELTDDDIKNALQGLINQYQLSALIKRVRKLKNALALTPSDKFLNENEWSEDTIKEELSGKYLKTYLSIFLDGYDRLPQPWIKN